MKHLDNPGQVVYTRHSILIKQSKEIVMEQQAKPITVNATVFWANLKQVNELSGKFQVDLGELSAAAVDAIEQRGITVAQKDEQGQYITCKSKNPIKAYNTAGDEITVAVGNGSKAKAVLSHYDWTFQKKKGRSPSIIKLIITDLEEYESVEVSDEELESAL